MSKPNLLLSIFLLVMLNENLELSVTHTKAFTNTTSYFSSFTDYLEPTVFSSEITYAGSTAYESYVMLITGKDGSAQRNITADTFYKANSQSVIGDTSFNVISFTYLTMAAEEPVDTNSKTSSGVLSLTGLLFMVFVR